MGKRKNMPKELYSYCLDRVKTAGALMGKYSNCESWEELSEEDLDMVNRLAIRYFEDIWAYNVPPELETPIVEFFEWNASLGGLEV